MINFQEIKNGFCNIVVDQLSEMAGLIDKG